MSTSNFTKKIITDVSVTSALGIVAILIDILLISILSRLLTPSDYGIVAAATLFLAFCGLLREIGIGATIIQMPKLSQEDQRTGLTLVMLMSLVIFVICQLGARAFSDFMNIPESEKVLRVLSCMVIFQSLSTISNSLMLRDLQIRRVMTIEIGSRFFSYAVVGVAMAWAGFSYWSLVAAMLCDSIINSMLLMHFARTDLRPQLHRATMRRLLGTGSGFASSRIINFIALRADVTIVGRYLDATSLGLYSRAYKLMSMPAELYSKVADRVVFPAMAKVQGEPARLRTAFLRGLTLTALFGLPMTVVIYLLSREIILVLLGPKWSATIDVFSILAIGSYFRLSARVSGSLLRARAAIRHLVATQTFYATATIGTSLFAVQYGIVAVGAAIGISIAAWFCVITAQACSVAKVSFMDVLRAHWHGVLLAILSGLLVTAVTHILRPMGVSSLVILLAAGAVLLLFVLAIVMLRPSFLLGAEGLSVANQINGILRRLYGKVMPAPRSQLDKAEP